MFLIIALDLQCKPELGFLTIARFNILNILLTKVWYSSNQPKIQLANENFHHCSFNWHNLVTQNKKVNLASDPSFCLSISFLLLRSLKIYVGIGD